MWVLLMHPRFGEAKHLIGHNNRSRHRQVGFSGARRRRGRPGAHPPPAEAPLVEGVCRSLVEQLGNLELIALAAFSEDFDEHACSEEFIGKESLEGFDVLDAVGNELYRQTEEFALKWAEGEVCIAGDSISDPRERLLNQVANRLSELLRESDDPVADRAEVVAMLQNNDLLDFVTARSALKQANPISFALAVLEENPLLFDAVDNLQSEFDPKEIETSDGADRQSASALRAARLTSESALSRGKRMTEWKARKTTHKGKVYYDVVSTAGLLRTTAARVRQLMGEGELEWTQLRLGGKLVVRAESIAGYKRRQSATIR